MVEGVAAVEVRLGRPFLVLRPLFDPKRDRHVVDADRRPLPRDRYVPASFRERFEQGVRDSERAWELVARRIYREAPWWWLDEADAVYLDHLQLGSRGSNELVGR